MIALVADANLEVKPAKAESDCERPNKAEVERPTGKGTDSRRNSKEVRDDENAVQEERCPRISPRDTAPENTYEVENKCDTEENGDEGMLAKKSHGNHYSCARVTVTLGNMSRPD